MDLVTATRERRSCRNFLTEQVDEATIEKILEAATWAPSPLNSQPWEFIVVTNKEMKEKIFFEGERCRKWARLYYEKGREGKDGVHSLNTP